ncbi:hypothetical protein QTP88_003422 [Uroleucon formosanum]
MTDESSDNLFKTLSPDYKHGHRYLTLFHSYKRYGGDGGGGTPESAERKSFRHQVHNKYVKKIYGRSAPECEPFCPLATCRLCGKTFRKNHIVLANTCNLDSHNSHRDKKHFCAFSTTVSVAGSRERT